MTQINLHDLSKLSAAERQRLLTRTEADLSAFEAKVDAIIAAVRDEGDEALARFAREFDKAPVEADAIAATPADFDAAERRSTRGARGDGISPPSPSAASMRTRSPRRCGCTRSGPAPSPASARGPIPSVACYVPRGKGAFPRVALMTTIPARGRRRARDRHRHAARTRRPIDDATLVAARMAGSTASSRPAAPRASPPSPTAPRPSPRVRQDRRPRQPLGRRGQAPASPTSSTPAPPPGRAS